MGVDSYDWKAAIGFEALLPHPFESNRVKKQDIRVDVLLFGSCIHRVRPFDRLYFSVVTIGSVPYV